MARGGARSGGSRPSERSGWVLAHVRAARDGLRHLRTSVLASGVSIAVMAVAMGLPATLFALLENQRALVVGWDAEPTLSVFLDKRQDLERAQALAALLRDDPLIVAVEVVSSAQAFAKLKNAAGLLGEPENAQNPLPNVLIITPAPAAWAEAQRGPFAENLRQRAEVDSVLVDFAWVERIVAIGALAKRALWVLALLLIGATILIVGNTIRVLVLGQVAEIEVLKLVGATDAFVRRPFLYSGALHGLLAGLVAVVLIEIVFLALAGPIADVAAAYMSEFALKPPSPAYVLGLVSLAGLTGWSGA